MSHASRPGRFRFRSTSETSSASSGQPARPLITQGQLKIYLWLERQAKWIEQQRQDVRNRLKSLYDSKADVEPGPLDIEFVESQAKIFTLDKVAAVIGTPDANDLRQKLAPTVTSFITVVDRTRG